MGADVGTAVGLLGVVVGADDGEVGFIDLVGTTVGDMLGAVVGGHCDNPV